MPGLADVLMVAVPAALTGGFGIYGGRQSLKLELAKLQELHRQKIEDRDHAERREDEAGREAARAARAAAVQRLLLAADATPPHTNIATRDDENAWTEFQSALAVVELSYPDLAAEGRQLGVGRWKRAEYAAARAAFIAAARPPEAILRPLYAAAAST